MPVWERGQTTLSEFFDGFVKKGGKDAREMDTVPVLMVSRILARAPCETERFWSPDILRSR